MRQFSSLLCIYLLFLFQFRWNKSTEYYITPFHYEDLLLASLIILLGMIVNEMTKTYQSFLCRLWTYNSTKISKICSTNFPHMEQRIWAQTCKPEHRKLQFQIILYPWCPKKCPFSFWVFDLGKSAIKSIMNLLKNPNKPIATEKSKKSS